MIINECGKLGEFRKKAETHGYSLKLITGIRKATARRLCARQLAGFVRTLRAGTTQVSNQTNSPLSPSPRGIKGEDLPFPDFSLQLTFFLLTFENFELSLTPFF
ncbi:MAG: hypothetical protein FJY07_04455 [Bacteroidetes bacterium]|nr:hypothetical protein [Bacteroidota bacterium]